MTERVGRKPMRDVVTASVKSRPNGCRVIYLRIGADLIGKLGVEGLRSLRVELKASRGLLRLSPGTGRAASWMLSDTGHQAVLMLGLASLGYDVPVHDGAHCQWSLDENHRLIVTLPTWACPPANTGGQRAVDWVEIVPTRGGRRTAADEGAEEAPPVKVASEKARPQGVDPLRTVTVVRRERPAAPPDVSAITHGVASCHDRPEPPTTAVPPSSVVAKEAPAGTPTCPLLGALLGQVLAAITTPPKPSALTGANGHSRLEEEVLAAAVRLGRCPKSDAVRYFAALSGLEQAARALASEWITRGLVSA